MVPVISQNRWLKWCKARSLSIDGAHFALETCYYGLGLRTRAGTILITDNELIHYSYSLRDTLWAIFEPSVKVVILLADMAVVSRFELTPWQKFYQAMPDSSFQAVTRDGRSHHFVLQRRGDEFAEALRARGFSVTGKPSTN